MPPKPYHVQVKSHPGSTAEEIENEPTWGTGHQHRVGFHNRQDRKPGLTHEGDEKEQYDERSFEQDAEEKSKELSEEVTEGKLINFRDVIQKQEDYHLRRPKDHPNAWRYRVNFAEDWIRNQEDWPANVKKRKDEEKQHEDEDGEEPESKPKEEHEWRRETNVEVNEKRHDARTDEDADHGPDSEQQRRDEDYQRLLKKYSPQEIALLKSLQHEKDYISKLKQNDGKRTSPANVNTKLSSIDEADQFSPDNWIVRSPELIRLTGKHPMNAEPKLSSVFEAGLVTPNEYHYVRNHGAVPHLLWETHTLDVENGKLILSMDDLRDNFNASNIQVALACDGNRRKEVNMIKRSKGFNWGSGAVSCAYWRGPLLRDVLLAAGLSSDLPDGRRYWVNFAGADEPSEGTYETCVPYEYAMDPCNDVILAQYMNDVPLPPDHGYPVRVIIPGYVGGRCVKWLRKIWVSDTENCSHYHIWDNRVLPSFITEKDGEFSNTMFAHPDTACNEQNLNSVIVKPAQGERMPLTSARKGRSYRIAGYAYDGGGHKVQRVEVSLDGGSTWLYCIRVFPEAPIRHNYKYWTWLHWHVDVDTTHLLRAESITVRCWNVFKNTQPERLSWNVMGMMNNCWHVVKPQLVTDREDGVPEIVWKHPAEPGTGEGGWMKPSVELQVQAAKQSAGTPEKQFTRAEVEKHDNKKDCWLVVDGKVYDATSVLSWHPGGAAAIIGHAGKVHQETSDEFASIHDDYAYQKLGECVLGSLTQKAQKLIEENAKDKAKELAASSSGKDDNIVLQKHRWTVVRLKSRKSLSDDTRSYTFSLPRPGTSLGLETCQHIQLGFHMRDRMLIRSYTPTAPILPRDQASGEFELVVKTYFPTDAQPGGAMSNILDCIDIGAEVEIKGPTGEIEYYGMGEYAIEGQTKKFGKVNLILGGSGVTPGYQLVARVMETEEDGTKLRVVDANKSEKDILLKEEFARLRDKSSVEGKFVIEHVLSHPSEKWEGEKGHVNAAIIKRVCFPPSDDTVTFLCGPPAMIQKAALPALRDWGFEEGENLFGF